MPEINPNACESFLTDDCKLCPRCSKDRPCCQIVWEKCQDCGGDGYVDHDCGDDTCCCYMPEDNVECSSCRGNGGWWECMGRCDKSGSHKREATNV